MAKMKIYEIARSIQQQDKNIKSGDLVTLLNENGFEVKGANSNIEDEAIGFLMNYFKKKKAAAKAEPKEEVKAPVKEEPKVEKKEEPKVEKKVEEKKEEPKVEKKPEEKKPEEKKPEEKKPVEKKPEEKKPEEKKVSSQKPQQTKKNDNYRKPNNNGQGRNDRNDRNDRDRRNGNGNGSRPDNRGNNGNNNGRRNDRNDRDRRGNNNGQNSRGDNRRNGNGNGNNNRVFERFEKAQSGFDGIKQEQKNSRQRNRKKDDRNNKTGGYRKSTKEEMSRIRSKKDPNRKGAFIKPEPVKQEPEEDIKQITIPESLTIRELADKMKMPAAALVKKLFMQGQMVSLNQEITFDEAEEIALSFDIIAELEEKVDMVAELLKEEEEDESKMKKRPPVVCVMGHVDHGKTSLLDAIRETDVTEHEAGGITQHIGAYVVRINGEKITFLDTPGHEAFTSMRMRGAQSTDIAILVVAADDGVMPQTIEAINHAKAAGIEIIVAINKIDKESANIERVKQELTEYELIPEDWGGSTIFCPVSAHTKEGIDNLLEMILLTADVLELKANPNRKARGIVIEAELDKGRGPVATMLVQKGTLHVGDYIAVGASHGKVRAMTNSRGERVTEALPSTPVQIQGLNTVPDAGEIFMAVDNEKEARTISETYISQGKEKLLADTKQRMSLDDLYSQIQAGNLKELKIIIKADVQGSVEAVKQSLLKLSNDEVVIKCIHAGVGAINESDIILASASNAIVIGFNIRPDARAKDMADSEGVDVRLYRVIYNAIEDIDSAMKGMLDPIYEEKVIGHAEIRQTYKASGIGVIAGSYVLDGTINRNCSVRITREGNLIFEGKLASLKRFKDDVKEVKSGFECGMVFENFQDVAEEDQIEAYEMVEVPRK